MAIRQFRSVVVLPVLILATNLLCSSGNMLRLEFIDQLAMIWQRINSGEIEGDDLHEARRWIVHLNLGLMWMSIIEAEIQNRPEQAASNPDIYFDPVPGFGGYPAELPATQSASNPLIVGFSADGESEQSGGFYANPFNGNSGHYFNASCIPYGWSPQAAGNFSYLKQYNHDGSVSGFVMLGYGDDPDSGLDVDGDGLPDGVVSMWVSQFIRDLAGNYKQTWYAEEKELAFKVCNGEGEICMFWKEYYIRNGDRPPL